MKIDIIIKNLKVKKGCININCQYCSENENCYLQKFINKKLNYLNLESEA